MTKLDFVSQIQWTNFVLPESPQKQLINKILLNKILFIIFILNDIILQFICDKVVHGDQFSRHKSS